MNIRKTLLPSQIITKQCGECRGTGLARFSGKSLSSVCTHMKSLLDKQHLDGISPSVSHSCVVIRKKGILRKEMKTLPIMAIELTHPQSLPFYPYVKHRSTPHPSLSNGFLCLGYRCPLSSNTPPQNMFSPKLPFQVSNPTFPYIIIAFVYKA